MAVMAMVIVVRIILDHITRTLHQDIIVIEVMAVVITIIIMVIEVAVAIMEVTDTKKRGS